MPVADQSRWRYVLTDMNGNTATGGGPLLNGTQKTFSNHLNAGKTAQLTIGIDNPRANFLLGNNCLLKVYRQTRASKTWQRMMVGDVIQADESAQGDTGLITLVAADPWWRLQRRLLGMGMNSAGQGTGYTDGTVTALKDNSILLMDMLNAANSVFPTGIQAGTTQNCGTTSYVGPVFAQNLGDQFQQLCNTLGGPTFELVPLEPSGLMPNTIIAQMNVWGAYGQTRANVWFEYGTGKKNVISYDRILSKDGLCNQVYSPPTGFPSVTSAGDAMIISQDTASQNSIGLYQDMVQNDVTNKSLRQELTDEVLAVRKTARQQIVFTPSVDNWMDYGVDYLVGDVVGARAYVGGGYRFNGTARIYGADFQIDDNDAETVALTLIPGG